MNIWAIIHNLVSHPLMGITGAFNDASIAFHDWSAEQAWPREEADA